MLFFFFNIPLQRKSQYSQRGAAASICNVLLGCLSFSDARCCEPLPLPPPPNPPPTKRRKPQSAINTIMINYGAQLQFTHLPNCNSSLVLFKKCERAENPPHSPLLMLPQLLHFLHKEEAPARARRPRAPQRTAG